MAALQEDLESTCVAARHFDVALLRVTPSSGPSEELQSLYHSFARHAPVAEL
jgi:hypothetical protein